MSNFEGSIPAIDENVIVFGSIEMTETGFNFLVDEVRRSGEQIMKRKVSNT